MSKNLIDKPQIANITRALKDTIEAMTGGVSSVDEIVTSVDQQNNLTITLKNKGVIVSSSSVKIITTSILQSAYFDQATGELVLIFSNGQELRFQISSLISGLLPMALGFTFTPANWVQVAGTNHYMYDLTATINAILSNIPVYTPVTLTWVAQTPSGSENPSELHWCERSGEEGQYVYSLTSDTSVVSGKTYYSTGKNPSTEGWYKKNSSGEYVASTDTYVDPSNTYFTKSGKSLSGTMQFDSSVSAEAQAVLDVGTTNAVFLVTTKVASTWKLHAYALDAKPLAQFTLPVDMVVVAPSQVDMTLVGKPVYKSVKSIPYEVMEFTNKTFDADGTGNVLSNVDAENMSSYVESDTIKKNIKALEVQIKANSGLGKDSAGLKHTNSVTAQTTAKLGTVKFDAQGHITEFNETTAEKDIAIVNNKIGHSNTAITAQTTAKVFKTTVDQYGHNTGAQTGYDVQVKGDTLSDDDTHLLTSGKAKEELDKKVAYDSTEHTGMTRDTLFALCDIKNTKIFSAVTFTSAELPSSSASTSTHFQVEVWKWSATEGVMTAKSCMTGIAFITFRNSAGWQAWKQVATADNSMEITVAFSDGTTQTKKFVEA